jgi:aspartate/methionine/tyrosine aminotransferase
VNWALKKPDLFVIIDASQNILSKSIIPTFSDNNRILVLLSLPALFGTTGLQLTLLYGRDPEAASLVYSACGLLVERSSMTEWAYRKLFDAPIFNAQVEAFWARFPIAQAAAVSGFEKEGHALTKLENSTFALLDLSSRIKTKEEELSFAKRLLEEQKVFVVPAGEEFGCETAGNFVINCAVPEENIAEGIARILKGISGLAE